jgi:sugar phosphate isomerase/epimerase
MKHLIACRIANYGPYVERGWSHLAELGVRYVEIKSTDIGDLTETKRKLADHGLAASSLHAMCDLAAETAVQEMTRELDAGAALGAKIAFLSAKPGQTPLPVIYDRLRAIGEEARQHGMTIALETHPPLVTNGDVARATLEAIGHPCVRINFDTANIYFYNRNTDTLAELKKVLDLVASVHLKDSYGGYKVFDFPALGEGIVDFPAVFSALDGRRFSGPYTLELEGTEGLHRSQEEQLAHVAESTAYLRGIGVMDR